MGCYSCIGIFAQECANEVPLFPYTSNTATIGCSYRSTSHRSTSLTHFQWMFRTFCEFSPDYLATLRQLSNPEGLRLADRIVQFPFVAPVSFRGISPATREVDEKSRKRSRRRNSRGWQRGEGRQAGVYKKWRLRNERRR